MNETADVKCILCILSIMDLEAWRVFESRRPWQPLIGSVIDSPKTDRGKYYGSFQV